jgi:hypothetical protein
VSFAFAPSVMLLLPFLAASAVLPSSASLFVRAVAVPQSRTAIAMNASPAMGPAPPTAVQEALQAEVELLRAAAASAEERVAQLEQEIATLKATGTLGAADAQAPSRRPVSEDMISKAFDAVDEDGNGVLDLEEYRIRIRTEMSPLPAACLSIAPCVLRSRFAGSGRATPC